MDTLDLNPDKYRLVRALRPFSYSVALVTCGLGVVLAYQQGNGNGLRALLVILAGLLLQAACNLANDHADITLWRKQSGELASQVIQQIRLNFVLAGVFSFIACLMGLWLVKEIGWQLLVLGIFGVIGGYFYTGEPVNYKQRGWGVPAVFLFTGVLMVSGAYYAVGGVWSNEVVWISIPVSLLASALILSNEIRDYLDDINHNIRTLTVRIGLIKAKWLYAILLLAVFPLSFVLYHLGELDNPLYLLISLPFAIQPLKLLSNQSGDAEIVRLPPLTGRFFIIFGLGFILSIVL
ncbi:prenyltransferase [Endozoicomonas elysicola]|uniref:1,4-dihydroxy-2-naphthoate octaprenyltransferase n=1 Tax=Endozoicomonas elysicola TaxID=305900 RepID=A0A081KDR4_9GAMM|nr:prenyltransferase [Endozoicomonas elysicola]KEI72290.1 hypothetical protein GV64_17545 [Endozoicomonas elysicola]